MPERFGPDQALDGETTDGEGPQFISQSQVYPWIQLEFDKEIQLEKVLVTNRKDGAGERFRNAGVHIGNVPAVIGQLNTNPLCSIFVGPSSTGAVEEIVCDSKVKGKYLVIQLINAGNQYLQINELEVFANVPGNDFV